jgi:hypothetical protein
VAQVTCFIDGLVVVKYATNWNTNSKKFRHGESSLALLRSEKAVYLINRRFWISNQGISRELAPVHIVEKALEKLDRDLKNRGKV